MVVVSSLAAVVDVAVVVASAAAVLAAVVDDDFAADDEAVDDDALPPGRQILVKKLRQYKFGCKSIFRRSFSRLLPLNKPVKEFEKMIFLVLVSTQKLS